MPKPSPVMKTRATTPRTDDSRELSCNCKFAKILRYIAETVRVSTKVTTECK